MADWSKPTNSSSYAAYTAENDARMDDLAVGLDPAIVTTTNVPAYTIRWSSANGKWQRLDANGNWGDLASTYAINISGNAATATRLATARTINGVNFDGTGNISVSASTPNALTFSSGTTGGAAGSTFNGGSALTVNYATVGAPSTTGTNASGTWGINISGNAATATARNINGVSFNHSADIVVEPYVENDETSNATRYIAFVQSTGSAYKRLYADGGMSYNPNTNTLSVNVAGNASTASNATNAASATKLATARSINGVGFDGTTGIEISEWIHSSRDFTVGTLITTSINYGVEQGDPFVLEIRGNSYGHRIPFQIQYQGYIYSNTIINAGGYSVGANLGGMVALNVSGWLCFWFPRQSYWQGFNVRAYTAYPGRQGNRVIEIIDSAKPSGTKEVGITLQQVLRDDNFNSYAPTLTGGNASGTWGINITGRAYPRRSDGGDLNFYWSGQSGQPTWLWGGTDGANMYVYNPSNFSVNYATSAGTASSASTVTNGVYTTGSYANPSWITSLAASKVSGKVGSASIADSTGSGGGGVSTNLANGTDALANNTTGFNNTATGVNALTAATTGYDNTAIGYNALSALTTGDSNVAVGKNALSALTTAYWNTAIGYNALSGNTVYLNCSGVGASAQVTNWNQVQLGNSITTTYVYGTVQNRSDLRDKADVQDTALGLKFIQALHPVDYRWDMREDYRERPDSMPMRPVEPAKPGDDASESDLAAYTNTLAQYEQDVATWKAERDAWIERNKLSNIKRDGSKKRQRLHHGLIAQEVKHVMDQLGIDFGGYQDHSVKGGDDVLSIGYDELVGPLIKAVQELAARVEALEGK